MTAYHEHTEYQMCQAIAYSTNFAAGCCKKWTGDEMENGTLNDRKLYFVFQGAAPESWMLEAGEYTMKRFASLYGMTYGGMATNHSLRWHTQVGNIVIPGSKNPDHIRSNFDLFDFTLTAEELTAITAMDKKIRYYTSTPELLKAYAEIVPPVDEQI